MKKQLVLITIIIFLTFLLNFVWEMLQMPLYQIDADWWGNVQMCAVAGLGDVLMVLGILCVVRIASNNYMFPLVYKTGDYILVLFIGLLLAVIFEQFAIITTRWAYNDLMPLVPVFNVGLSPLLQMMILPIIIFAMSKIIIEKFK